MKATIFGLFLIITFVSAQKLFVPEWKSCETSTAWNIYFVGLDSAPVAGKNSIWTVCPKILELHDAITMHVTAGTFFDLTLTPRDIRWTRYECIIFEFQIPDVSGEIVFNFDLKSETRASNGCLNVTLDPKSKSFLTQASNL